MKRMRDYSRWDVPRLQAEEARLADSYARLEAGNHARGATGLVLTEIRRQLALKGALA